MALAVMALASVAAAFAADMAELVASIAAAEAFSAADFLHGPVALAGPGHVAFIVDLGGVTSAPARETAERLHAAGGTGWVVQVGSRPSEGLPFPCLVLPEEIPEHLAALAAVVIMQRLAVAVADARGMDPASPVGLKKVTSTR